MIYKCSRLETRIFRSALTAFLDSKATTRENQREKSFDLLLSREVYGYPQEALNAVSTPLDAANILLSPFRESHPSSPVSVDCVEDSAPYVLRWAAPSRQILKTPTGLKATTWDFRYGAQCFTGLMEAARLLEISRETRLPLETILAKGRKLTKGEIAYQLAIKAEIDEGSLEEQAQRLIEFVGEGLPIPQLVTFSGGKSLHIEWVLSRPLDMRSQEDAALYARLEALALTLLEGDLAVANVRQEMRTPAFRPPQGVEGGREQPIVYFAPLSTDCASTDPTALEAALTGLLLAHSAQGEAGESVETVLSYAREVHYGKIHLKGQISKVLTRKLDALEESLAEGDTHAHKALDAARDKLTRLETAYAPLAEVTSLTSGFAEVYEVRRLKKEVARLSQELSTLTRYSRRTPTSTPEITRAFELMREASRGDQSDYQDHGLQWREVTPAALELAKVSRKCPLCGHEGTLALDPLHPRRLHCHACQKTAFAREDLTPDLPIFEATLRTGEHGEPLLDTLGTALESHIAASAVPPVILNCAPLGMGKTQLSRALVKDSAHLQVHTPRCALTLLASEAFDAALYKDLKGSKRIRELSERETPRLASTVHSSWRYAAWECTDLIEDEYIEASEAYTAKQQAQLRASMLKSLIARARHLQETPQVVLNDACGLNKGHVEALKILAGGREIVGLREPSGALPRRGCRVSVITQDQLTSTLLDLGISGVNYTLWTPTRRDVAKYALLAQSQGLKTFAYTANNRLLEDPDEAWAEANAVIYNGTIGSGVSCTLERFSTCLAVINEWGYGALLEDLRNGTASMRSIIQALFRARAAKNYIICIPYKGWNGCAEVPSVEEIESGLRAEFGDEKSLLNAHLDPVEDAARLLKVDENEGALFRALALMLYGDACLKQCVISRLIEELRDRYGCKIEDASGYALRPLPSVEEALKKAVTAIAENKDGLWGDVTSRAMETASRQVREALSLVYDDAVAASVESREHYQAMGYTRRPKAHAPSQLALAACEALGWGDLTRGEVRRLLHERNEGALPIIAGATSLKRAHHAVEVLRILAGDSALDALRGGFTHPQDSSAGILRLTGAAPPQPYYPFREWRTLTGMERKRLSELLGSRRTLPLTALRLKSLDAMRGAGVVMRHERSKVARSSSLDVEGTIARWGEVLPHIAKAIGQPFERALEWDEVEVDLTALDSALETLRDAIEGEGYGVEVVEVVESRPQRRDSGAEGDTEGDTGAEWTREDEALEAEVEALRREVARERETALLETPAPEYGGEVEVESGDEVESGVEVGVQMRLKLWTRGRVKEPSALDAQAQAQERRMEWNRHETSEGPMVCR